MLQSFILPFIKNYVPNGIRHLGSVAAGSLVTYGVINQSDSAQAAAAIVFLLSSLWSYAEKKGLLEKAFG